MYGPLYFGIETTSRELDSRLLLTAEALRRNYAVVIGKRSGVARIAKLNRRGIFFYNSHGEKIANTVYEPLSRAGVQCTALDEEGIVHLDAETYIKTKVQSARSLDYLSKVFVWGNKQSEWLSQYLGETCPEISKTGNPRFDLLKYPVSAVFLDDVTNLRKQYGSFVLVNTNFAPGNLAKFYNQNYMEMMEGLGHLKSEKDCKFHKTYMAYYEKLYKHYIEMISAVSKRFPLKKIILRPHPSEEISAWHKDFAHLDNVHVVRKGNVVPWILAADCVIHTGCTTGIEAFVGGKYVIRYNPIYESRFESELPNKLGNLCRTPNDLIANLELVFAGEFDPSGSQAEWNVLSEFIANSRDSWSYVAIIDQFDLMEYGVTSGNTISKLILKQGVRNVVLGCLSSFARMIEDNRFNYFGVKFPSLITRKTKKFPGISEDYLTERLDGFIKIVNKKCELGYVLKKIGQDLYLVMPTAN